MKPNIARLLSVILVFLSVLAFYRSGTSEFLELYVYDKLIQLQPAVTTTPPITVVTVTEEDIRQLERWPISDGLLAEVLTQLVQYEARVIGIDIYRDLAVPPGHEKLEAVFTRQQNIVAPMKFGDEKSSGVPPPPALREGEQFGFSDVLPDRDGIVRRGLLFLDDGQTVFYSFALRLALMYLQQEGITPQPDIENAAHIHLGSTTIRPFEPNDGGYVEADARGYQFPLDFCKAPKAIPRYQLAQFRSGEIRLEDFRDKVVLVGVVAESVKDYVNMPCTQGAGNDQRVSGVLLHAAIVDQLLRIAQNGHAPLTNASDWQEMIWIFIWTLAGGFISQQQRSLVPFLLVWAGGISVLGAVTALLFAQGIWLIAVAPALAWLLSGALITAYSAAQEKRERSLLMNLFSKHVAPEIAEEIWQKREQFFAKGHPQPQKTIATIMFTDLKGFTHFAETMEPVVLFDWLNEYLAGMTPLIATHGGVVIRLIGDAIFAGFGVPVPRQSETEIRQDAINAVCCALAMEKNLIQLNEKWRHQGLPVVAMRIGLFTGSLATGSIGDRNRMEYTVHGDTVNTAARLETFEKSQFIPDYFKQPCRILIGGETFRYLGQQFRVESVGNVELKGKEQSIDVYRVIGEKP